MVTVSRDKPSPEVDYTLGFICSTLGLCYQFVDSGMLHYGHESNGGLHLSNSTFFDDRQITTMPIIAGNGEPDLVATIFICLTNYDWHFRRSVDSFGRMLGGDSILARTDMLERPVVNEWVQGIGEMLKRRYGHLQIDSKPWLALCSTHDIDTLTCNRPGSCFFNGWRYRTLRYIEDIEGIGSYYFMTLGDGDIRKREITKFAKHLAGQKHEVGLHADVGSSHDLALLQHEVNLVKQSIPAVVGIRNHYLMWSPKTWQIQEKVGLKYDTTISYPDRVGFRCGVCTPFRPFDVNFRQMLHLWEVPLLVMDVTLRDYMNLTTIGAEVRLLSMMDCVMNVGGIFTSLWHSTFLEQHPEWKAVYGSMIGLAESVGVHNMTVWEAVNEWAQEHDPLVLGA